MPLLNLPTTDRLENLAQWSSRFVSGPWGTHAGFALMMFWVGASFAIGWDKAYSLVDEIVTMISFLLLFLLQRSQAKDTLAMQVKLNELLAAVHKASPHLINLEDKSEKEVQEIHERFSELHERTNESCSIDEISEEIEAGRGAK